MGCCCSKDGSDVDSLDEPLMTERLTESESGSIAGSRHEDERTGPIGKISEVLPALWRAAQLIITVNE
jgi:hypothetical protein